MENEVVRKKRPLSPEHIEILKKRRRNLIYAMAAGVAVIILIIMAATGTFDKKASKTTLTVKSDGKIVFEELMEAEDGVSVSDVKAYAKETIKDYNSKNGSGSVKLKKCSKKGDNIYLKTVYKSAEVYADFTSYDFYVGTIKDAKSAGYEFDKSFVEVSSGKKGDSVEEQTVTEDDSSKVIIADQSIVVAAPSDIKYVSDTSTKVSGKKVTVSDAVISYIVY